MANASETAFYRAVEGAIAKARSAVQECIRMYLSTDTENRAKAAAAAYESVNALGRMLDASDWPVWLEDLRRDLKFARDHSLVENGIIAVDRIASDLNPRLQNDQWSFATSESGTGFNFDAIYEKHRSACKLPELFDQLIAWLKEIVASDAIDSVKAIRELNGIIATLQSARDGSYFATRGAWFFVATWFKNTGWELLSDIPGVGSAVKGLRKTLEDTNQQMQTLHEDMQADLEAQISTDFPRLEYRPPELPAIEYAGDLEDDNEAEIAT